MSTPRAEKQNLAEIATQPLAKSEEKKWTGSSYARLLPQLLAASLNTPITVPYDTPGISDVIAADRTVAQLRIRASNTPAAIQATPAIQNELNSIQQDVETLMKDPRNRHASQTSLILQNFATLKAEVSIKLTAREKFATDIETFKPQLPARLVEIIKRINEGKPKEQIKAMLKPIDKDEATFLTKEKELNNNERPLLNRLKDLKRDVKVEVTKAKEVSLVEPLQTPKNI